jgi:hypothetical protein
LLLARDLKLLETKEHRELDQAVIEVKRMLAGLLQKLNADSSDRKLLFSEILLA